MASVLNNRKCKFSKLCVAQKYRADLYSKNSHNGCLRHSDVKSVASRTMILYFIITYINKFINFNITKFPTLNNLSYTDMNLFVIKNGYYKLGIQFCLIWMGNCHKICFSPQYTGLS